MKFARPFFLLAIGVGIVSTILYLESLKSHEETESGERQKAPVEIGDPYREIVNPSGFINSETFQLSDYVGEKVILIDFWTYSCINCQRTLPYLNAWHEEYANNGLLIVGIHTPEFEFEKELENVRAAVDKHGVDYPVVLDNDKGSWRAYGNRYWPRKYLIDLDGTVVYDHIGEGAYEETEQWIRALLGSGGDMSLPENATEVDFERISSPEIYFGMERNEYLGNGEKGVQGVQTLTVPEDPLLNTLYLEGTWDFTEEYSETITEASIVFKYEAKNVYMVASSPEEMEIEIWVDGSLLGTVMVQEEDLYPLVEGEDYSGHLLEIRIPTRGFKAFTFSFG